MNHPAAAYFESPQPSALELPHLITALDAELIAQVGHLTKARPGLWHVPAPFDDQDRFDNLRTVAPLEEWSSPLNQAEAQGLRFYVAEAIFSAHLMFVDSAADEKILTTLAVTTGRRLETGAYVSQSYADIPTLPALIEQIGWALIPLGPERSKAIFLTCPARAERVGKLRDWCASHGRNHGVLRREGGALIVTDEPAPEKFRANAMAQRIETFLGTMEGYFGAADPAWLLAIEQRLEARRDLRRRIEQSKQATLPPA